jgi:hypothetical protein
MQSSHPNENIFFPGLTDRQQTFCRCLLDVDTKKGKYNPYAICTASVKQQAPCGAYYIYENLSDERLRAFAFNHGISISIPYDRNSMLLAIYAYKQQENLR